jgi:hypothetical protein
MLLLFLAHPTPLSLMHPVFHCCHAAKGVEGAKWTLHKAAQEADTGDESWSESEAILIWCRYTTTVCKGWRIKSKMNMVATMRGATK